MKVRATEVNPKRGSVYFFPRIWICDADYFMEEFDNDRTTRYWNVSLVGVITDVIKPGERELVYAGNRRRT
jgi:hypothetical protein